MADINPIDLKQHEVQQKQILDYTKEQRSIQSEINELLKEEVDVTEKIKKLDSSKIDKVVSGYSKIKTLTIQYKEQLSKSSEIYEKIKDLTQEEARVAIDAFDQKLKDIQTLISFEKELIKLEQQEAQFNYDSAHKWHIYLKSTLSSITGFNSEHYKQYSENFALLKKFPTVSDAFAGSLSTVFVILKSTYKLFLEFDKQAFLFRKQMGMLRSDVSELRSIIQKTAINFMHVGVTIEGAYAALSELGKEMGSIFTITEDIVKTTALISAQLGVSENSTAIFLRNMAAISGTVTDIQKDMVFVTAKLSQAAGVPLDKVMKDVGSRSNEVLTMMSRYPMHVIKASVELRKMNTSLQEAAKSSRQLLDFTSNVQAEMEASVLLGRSINLQRARELAYRRDLEGSTREILRLTREIDFENLDVFQQEAFATATGKSVDELLRMVQAEKEWEKARNDPRLSAKVAEYDRLKNINKEMLKDEGKRLEQMIMVRSNQERINAISQKWNQILAKLGEMFLPIIDKALAIAPPLLDIASIVVGLIAPFGQLLSKVGAISALFTRLATILPLLGKFSIFFAGKLPVIGWIITGLQAIANIWDRISKIDLKSGIGNVLQEGFFAILGGLRDTIISPFVSLIKWFKGSDLAGHSPSKIGLSLLKGISSVEGKVYDSLITPFKDANEFIGKQPTGGPAIGNQIAENVSSEVQKSADVVKPAQIIKQESNDGANMKLLQGILNEISALNSNLESGKIRIYIDGNLLNSTMARNSEFFGGFGVNNLRA